MGGALSDRVGRRPILIGSALLAVVTAYPALSWLMSSPSFGHLLAVELWLSLIYGFYNGAMIVHLTEIVPEDLRTSGFSMAYSLATIFGGMTPAICTGLIRATGDGAMPGSGWPRRSGCADGDPGCSRRTYRVPEVYEPFTAAKQIP